MTNGKPSTVPPQQSTLVGDDHVLPFEVNNLDARGRAVQLGPAIDSILKRHSYPEPVSKLLAQLMTLTVILGSSLKFDGKFIVQTSSDGPVHLIVCDFQTPSNLRGYAQFDLEKLENFRALGKCTAEDLLGKGTLALTVDQGSQMQRYQGIVALDGSSLEDIARNYFDQSEQIPTQIRLAVSTLLERKPDGSIHESWRAGGLLIQSLPTANPSEDDQSRRATASDHWREVQALVSTIESSELTDPQIGSELLLYRLFHESGVRVFSANRIVDKCSCSREKIADVLTGLSAQERERSIEDGAITVTCQFCSTVYRYTLDEFPDS